MGNMENILASIILLLGLLTATEGQSSGLVCIPGVDRFSSKISPQHYYQCDQNVGKNPELQECPQGQRYSRKKQECVEDTGPPEPEYLQEKSLGQNVQLGAFYNARTGIFSPESSFWSRQTLNNAAEKRNDTLTKPTFTTTDTLAKAKMKSMDISADLTLKFMAGFITLHGHFGYIVEKVNREEQVNVQMNYYTKYRRSSLPKQTPIDYRDQCDNPDVTHVVSTVIYGMGAVFNFQRVLKDDEDRSAIEAGLELSIKIIPGISVGGGIDVAFNDTIIDILNSTTIQMFGDFSPDADQPLPTTWNDSVEFYKTLPTLSGSEEDDWAGTTIVEVEMTPIQEYCEDSGNIVDQISPKLMNNLNSMFDELDQLEVKNGGLLNREPAVLYQPIRQNLNLYKTRLQAFRLELQQKLQEILPNILGDPQLGEEELVALLEDYNDSQFEFLTSADFMTNRDREIFSVQYLMNRFPKESNIALADYEMANDVEFIFKKKMVIVLDFHILTPKSLTQGFLDGAPVDESNFWFNNNSAIGGIGEPLRRFSDFALANVNREDRGYLIKLSLVDSEPKKISVMSALVNGQLISDEFAVPPELSTPEVFGISHNRFKFNVPKGNKFVTGCIVYIKDNIGFPPESLPLCNNSLPLYNNSLPLYNSSQTVDTIDREVVQMFLDDPEDKVEIVAYDLSPGRAYSFHVAYLTEVGSSPPCSQSEEFWTAPVSPPTLLSADVVSSDSILLSWQAPDVIAEYLHINKSLVSYKIQMENGPEYITTDLKKTFTSLDPGTKYEIEVRAFISPDITNSTELPDSIASVVSVFTVPLPPQQLVSSNIDEHSVELSWNTTTKLNQADTLYYIVEYASDGATAQHVVKETRCKITGLARGTAYSFSVKVVTIGGPSELSEPLKLETLYVKTEFEELKEELENSMRDLKYNAAAMSTFCSFKATTNEEKITYEKIYVDINNVNRAAMDISTGTFTAGATASYQISANLEMSLTGGQYHDVWLVVDGTVVEESRMSSDYDQSMPGTVTDNGSTNTVLKLTAGDTVYLAHQTNGDEFLNFVTFCVSLINIE